MGAESTSESAIKLSERFFLDSDIIFILFLYLLDVYMRFLSKASIVFSDSSSLLFYFLFFISSSDFLIKLKLSETLFSALDFDIIFFY